MRNIKGSLTVEAAILLPIFLFFILSLAYFIKVIYIHENIQYAINETAGELASYSYVLEKIDVDEMIDIELPFGSSSQGMEQLLDLTTGAASQTAKDLTSQSVIQSLMDHYVSPSQYDDWFIIGGKDGLDFSYSTMKNDDIEIIVNYNLKIPIPIPGLNKLSLFQRATARVWKGNGNFNSEAPKIDGQKVYITEHGAKYHTDLNCRHISIKTENKVYGEVKDSRRPCNICSKNMNSLTDSTIVIVTPSGECFHSDSYCSAIYRNVKTITLEQAINNGYTLCKTCSKGGKK